MTSRPAGGGGGAERSSRSALAMGVIMAGVLITAVDTTIVVLALPEIEHALHIALASVIWVIIGYLLVITLLATQVGRLGDLFGRVRMYEAGFLVFVVGSALCALAWNEWSIIVFRLLQGVGGALVTANSGAIIADLYPPERRGRAYGLYSIGWTVGAVIGIVLGGLMVTYVSWRWIFWINVPIGLAALAVALRVLHDQGGHEGRRFDVAGMVTAALGLFGVLWAVTELASSPLTSSLIGYLVGGVVFLVVFVLVERSRREPMVDLSIFSIPTMSASLVASLVQGLASYAVLFLVIMYLQGPRGLSPIHASLLLVPGYVIGSVTSPMAGHLSDRLGPAIPATFGLAVQVVALLVYASMGTGTGLWVVVLASIINGVGSSFFYPANSAAVMKASPPEVFGISSGMLRTFSNVGMVFSFSMAILIASRAISRQLAFAIFVGTAPLHGRVAAAFVTGVRAAFYASMGLLVLAGVLSALRIRRPERRDVPVAAADAARPAGS